MKLRHRSSPAVAVFAFASALFAASVWANQLVYVPLDQPCRLLDTRVSTGGPGPLNAGNPYLFGTSTVDISSIAQNGNAAGCGIATDAQAVSVNMNLLNTSASGNIASWSVDAGTSAPNIGTAVYNPSVTSAAPGQVTYNTGYTTIPIGRLDGANKGRFYLQVANGQIDMTINVVGYWLPISWGETRSGVRATALGNTTTASGYQSPAIGFSTTASGFNSTAIGSNAVASGNTSVAMGNNTNASGDVSTAIGIATIANGHYSTAMGNSVKTTNGSFIYGDRSHSGYVQNDADNQFMVVATGGVKLVTAVDANGVPTAGVKLAGSGGSSWTTISDRNAKTAIAPVNAREVLDKVAAMPMNTWQYKAQAAKYRHMGPMAQDFYAAFNLGESDTGIDTVDADGVALAAIQGLNAKLEEKNAAKDAEIAALRERLSIQDARVAVQNARIAALESADRDLAEIKRRLAALQQATAVPLGLQVALKP